MHTLVTQTTTADPTDSKHNYRMFIYHQYINRLRKLSSKHTYIGLHGMKHIPITSEQQVHNRLGFYIT